MKRIATLLLGFACLGMSGCFAISDLGRFEVDRGCDVDLHLTAFTPHADDLLELRVVRPAADITLPPTLAARALLDPMGSVNAHIVMPSAAPPGDSDLEFYSDENGNRAYDEPSADHVWRIRHTCVPVQHEFVHQFDFARLVEPTPIGEDFHLDMTGMAADGHALEVRVMSMPAPETADVEPPRNVGLYRFASVTSPDLTVVIPGIIDTGIEYQVTIWYDKSGDGFYDAPPVDESWTIPAQLGSQLTSLSFAHVEDYNEIDDNVVTLE